MTEYDDIYNFMKTCEAFVNSSEQLRDAAGLVDEDPVKQDMVAFIIPDFNQMWARSEGIKVLLEGASFAENREFVLQEMEAVTEQNLKMAQQIIEKLAPLTWN